MQDYKQFIESKKEKELNIGFSPKTLSNCLFGFQDHLVRWSLLKGRSALFEECGLGKTVQQLVWAEQICKRKKAKVLIVTPLAVSGQTEREASKFGVCAKKSRDGRVYKCITITNYERLHYFNPRDFRGVVLDESSILKSFDGKLRKSITDFMQKIEFRLLCTATPAPNDYMELGTSSEALSVMTRNNMLGMFFTHDGKTTQEWALKGHARKRFWEWMYTWSRTIRQPSDIGFVDDGFKRTKLNIQEHRIRMAPSSGSLFTIAAKTLNQQRDARNRTINERCEYVKHLIPSDRSFVCWCHLNNEADLLEQLIPDAVQVSGRDSDDSKESKLADFANGNIRVLITKPRIGGFGLNWQHCSDTSYFPSHSYEQFYQCLRRFWRFGQTNPVNCHIVFTDIEQAVFANMMKKEIQVDAMYNSIIKEMSKVQKASKKDQLNNLNGKVRIPAWLRPIMY